MEKSFNKILTFIYSIALFAGIIQFAQLVYNYSNIGDATRVYQYGSYFL